MVRESQDEESFSVRSGKIKKCQRKSQKLAIVSGILAFSHCGPGRWFHFWSSQNYLELIPYSWKLKSLNISASEINKKIINTNGSKYWNLEAKVKWICGRLSFRAVVFNLFPRTAHFCKFWKSIISPRPLTFDKKSPPSLIHLDPESKCIT